MRVLVTGASGHVGGAIAAALVAGGHQAVALSRRRPGVPGLAGWLQADVGTPDAAERAGRELERCAGIVHAAASLARDPHAASLSLANCLGTQQMVQLGAVWGVERFVYISSVPVVGRPRELPITEAHPTDPPTPYHAAKLYGEQLVELARRRRGPGTTLRLSSPVGPGMPRGRIVSELVLRAMAGEPLEIAGRGTRRQDYVDVRDVADAVAACLVRPAEGCFNVAAGRTVSNEELARRCVETLGSRSPIRLGDRPDPEEGVRWEVSIARAAAGLGYRPQRSIEDSIRAVAADFRA